MFSLGTFTLKRVVEALFEFVRRVTLNHTRGRSVFDCYVDIGGNPTVTGVFNKKRAEFAGHYILCLDKNFNEC